MAEVAAGISEGRAPGGAPAASARVVFMGSDPIALPLLDALYTAHAARVALVGVYTQPDRASGRGMKLHANEIKQWALARGIEVRQPQRCGPEDVDWLRAQSVDLVLVMAYGQILKRALIDTPPLGTLNFHASLLPHLRGASPIQTAVAIGERSTGVSLMRIVPKLDAGPVMDCEAVAIGPEDTAACVRERLAQACVPLLARALPRILDRTARFTEQDPARVTYCRILAKTDAQLDFRASATELHDRIRGLMPWPGASMTVAGETLRIGAARVCADTRARGGGAATPPPGTLEVADNGRSLRVHCGEGALCILELQRPGGRMLPIDAFLRGHTFPPGARAEPAEMSPLVAPEPFPWRGSQGR